MSDSAICCPSTESIDVNDPLRFWFRSSSSTGCGSTFNKGIPGEKKKRIIS